MSIANTAPVFAAITKSNQVSVFSYPNLNGSDTNPGNGTENANLASIVQSIINGGGDYRLDTSIKSFADTSLRAKLEPGITPSRLIINEPGIGYRLNA